MTAPQAMQWVVEQLPNAEAMLDVANEPELAAFVAALGATYKIAQAVMSSRAFDATAAVAAADAAADAALRLKFPRPAPPTPKGTP